MKHVRYKGGCGLSPQLSHSHYGNILLPIRCKRGCGLSPQLSITPTTIASHRLRRAYEVKGRGPCREPTVPTLRIMFSEKTTHTN